VPHEEGELLDLIDLGLLQRKDDLQLRVPGPAVKFYETTGVDAATSTPEELAKFQASESQKWGRIVGAAKIEKE